MGFGVPKKLSVQERYLSLSLNLGLSLQSQSQFQTIMNGMNILWLEREREIESSTIQDSGTKIEMNMVLCRL